MDITKITAALAASMDPTVSNEVRKEALLFCNSVRNDDRCIHIGLEILRQSAGLDCRVQYFGLELIKYKIRMCWISLSDAEKSELKQTVMNMISMDLSGQPGYFLNTLGSILNEIVKHTWPQAWPDMIDEVILQFVTHGTASSTEVLLVMLLNLVEDVALYQNVPSKSRLRDLKQGLSLSAEQLMRLLVNVLKKHLENPQKQASLRTLQIILKTIVGYVEWIKVECIAMDNFLLLKLLCNVLSVEELRLQAAECFDAISGRRGKAEKLIILKLADIEFISKFKEVLQSTISCQQISDGSDLNFFCKIGGFFTNLVEIIISLYDENGIDGECVKSLKPFEALFDLLYMFLNHESRFICSTAVHSWLLLLRSYVLRDNPSIAHCSTLLISAIAKRVTDRQLIEQSSCVSIEEMEYNDNEELTRFYKNHDLSLAELFRECAKRLTSVAIESCLKFAKAKLPSLNNQDIAEDILRVLSFFFENTMPQAAGVLQEQDKLNMLPLAEMENVLYSFTRIQANKSICKQYLLTIVYKLVEVLTLVSQPSPTTFLQVLVDYILAILEVEQKMREVRRHCFAILLKVAKTRGHLLKDLFQHFKLWLSKVISNNPNVFTLSEKRSIYEILIMSSGKFEDLSIQRDVIVDAMDSISSFIYCEYFTESLKSPESFLKACGFHENYTPESNKYQQTIKHLIALTSSVLKRSHESWCGRKIESFQLPTLNQKLLSSIESCLTITHHISCIWSPELRSLISSENLKALEERKPSVDKADGSEEGDGSNKQAFWLQLHSFLFKTHEMCYTLLGHICLALKSNFYQQTNIKDVLVNNVLSKIHYVPISQLKFLMKHFLLIFIKTCPSSHVENVVLPILSDFCLYMLERLHPEWENYAQLESKRLENSGNGESCQDDDKMEEEIYKDMLLRVTSRDYLEFLISICVNKTPPPVKSEPSNKKSDVVINNLPVTQLTEFGTCIVSTNAWQQVWNTALLALTWYDGQACTKAAFILSPNLKLAFKSSELLSLSPLMVSNLFEAILRGLNRHGNTVIGEQSLFPIAIAVLSYFLSSHKQSLIDILTSALPGSHQQVIQFFTDFPKLAYKKQKLAFKSLVAPIIEQHVSEKFREIPDMNQYASINELRQRTRRSKKSSEEAFNGLARLFDP